MENKPLLDDFILRAEAAEQLGLTERTLKQWHAMRRGPLPVYIGKRAFYRRADWQEYLAKNAAEQLARYEAPKAGRRARA